MNFLKLRHQNMKNYNANPRPYGRGFFIYRNQSYWKLIKTGKRQEGKILRRFSGLKI